MADYISQTDLEHALSTSTVRAFYDDDQDQVADDGPIASCIAYATAECDSYLRSVLSATDGGDTPVSFPLSIVPDEVKFAALDFGIAYTIRRRPDIAKAMGDLKWTDYATAAKERMQRYCELLQRVPKTTAAAGQGGALLNPESDNDGAALDPPAEGRWSDMGGFA